MDHQRSLSTQFLFVHFVVVVVVVFGFLAMQDLSSLTRDGTCTPPAVEVQSLNHWKTREDPYISVLGTL